MIYKIINETIDKRRLIAIGFVRTRDVESSSDRTSGACDRQVTVINAPRTRAKAGVLRRILRHSCGARFRGNALTLIID